MQQEQVTHTSVARDREPSEPLRGQVLFLSAEEQVQRSVELLGAGALVVTLPAPTAHTRGHLASLLEELVERELARMGAPSPYLAAWSAMPDEAEARLADQLARAEGVGATGLALALGSLAAIAAPTLSTDDSALLRWLASTTVQAPLVLLVDDADLGLTGYAAPVALADLLDIRRDWSSPDIEVDIDLDIDLGPTLLTGDDATTNDTRVATLEAPASVEIQHLMPAASQPVIETVAPLELAGERPGTVDVAVAVAEPVAVAVGEPVGVGGGGADAEPAPGTRDAPAPSAGAASKLLQISEAEARAPAGRRGRAARSAIGVPVSGPNDGWRSWAIALAGARGAQPLSAFERLFAESYVPLANAVAGGLEDPRALRAYDEFRRSFERSYTDAFSAFGATNRRPRLVMDAFDIASKQARAANARSAHVLVVDSMRWDLGNLVRDALAREASGLVTLTSETLLWSALPTTTMRQLETFARGLDALRAPAQEEEASESLRGRAAEVVRRLRIGSREIYKLDLVPALLEKAGSDPVGALPAIADSVAEAIARHVSTLPARTLLFILGDHGFSLDRRGEIQMGGASPEEVLVPAQSWLVGELH